MLSCSRVGMECNDLNLRLSPTNLYAHSLSSKAFAATDTDADAAKHCY